MYLVPASMVFNTVLMFVRIVFLDTRLFLNCHNKVGVVFTPASAKTLQHGIFA